MVRNVKMYLLRFLSSFVLVFVACLNDELVRERSVSSCIRCTLAQ